MKIINKIACLTKRYLYIEIFSISFRASRMREREKKSTFHSLINYKLENILYLVFSKRKSLQVIVESQM